MSGGLIMVNCPIDDVKKIYVDYNATTPLEPEVITAIHQSMIEHWANPSSSHEEGIKAKHAVENARGEIAQMIAALPSDIVFVSGGTEANCMAIYSALVHHRKWCLSQINNTELSRMKPHIITTRVEHDAIKLPLTHKFSIEADVTFLNVDNLPEAVMDSIKPTTCLITVMLANNETGIMFPVAHIARLLIDVNKKRQIDGYPKILLHTDAAQAIGKVSVDVRDLNIDYLTMAGHKFYGPRIGALYTRNPGVDTPLYPLFYGGGQERGYRSGTENTPMIVGLGRAASIVYRSLHTHNATMKKTRNYLERQLKKAFGNFVKINCVEPCSVSDPELCSVPPKGPKQKHFVFPRLPNTSSISFYYKEVSGEEILKRCKLLQASTGAACNTNEQRQSVLEASGVCSFHANRTLRLSIGRDCSSEEMEIIVQDLSQAIFQITRTLTPKY